MSDTSRLLRQSVARAFLPASVEKTMFVFGVLELETDAASQGQRINSGGNLMFTIVLPLDIYKNLCLKSRPEVNVCNQDLYDEC